MHSGDFDAHCATLRVSGYVKRHLDVVESPQDLDDLRYQIVHCSGIIYHAPGPYRMLANLRRLTREHLILTSMVVPESIEKCCGNAAVPT